MSQLKANVFHFQKYKFNLKELKITFDYKIEFSNRASLCFKETIILPSNPKKYSKKTVDNFLKPLHLILGISYYKLYFPPKIKIPYSLSREESLFWNTIYKKGLGEFLYKNKLNPKKVASFPFKGNVKKNPVRLFQKESALLGIGGGKDSVVSLEILKGFLTTPFLIETQKKDFVSCGVIKKSGKKPLVLRRLLDKKIFENHKDGYSGHIPISAIFAFTGLLTAYLYDHSYVVVGNEKSSNFGNVNYLGEKINHQWSKSKEFERLFQEYSKKFITPDIIYFSILRRFYEIRIAKHFSKCKNYFQVFSSCNKNFKVFRKRNSQIFNKKEKGILWCKECPKCLFTFLILSPFLPKKELIEIFGKNLFNEKNLIPLFGEILGFSGFKPFDCVGTFKESRTALLLASKKFPESLIIKEYLPKINKIQKRKEELFKIYPESYAPSFFDFFGIEKACIIGYGKEGKITERYIKKYHPQLKLKVLDKATDKNYLKRQKDYDFAIKTSGIPKEKIEIPYTTATNIFFSKNKNFKIGVTGTKGKSTTVSLLYEILKEGGKKVRLLGNIGNPMHEVLLSKVEKDEIFVIELSSYMLSDIKYSPNIAVLLNLFPEHMDYHNGVENYYNAKKNIFKFQSSDDIALMFPFNEEIPFKKKEIPFWVLYNKESVMAAIKVARILKIPEKAIIKSIKNFKPLKHRLEFVGNFDGINFYNDASGTTPQSTIRAIEVLEKVDTIFLGGEDRGYDFSGLEKTIKKYKIKNLVLFPDTGEKIIKDIKKYNFIKTKSMKEAVSFAFKNTKRGKICLLSTASPSYSLWKNFEEKGEEFEKEVKNYRKSVKVKD